MLVSRFLLHLQWANQKSTHGGSSLSLSGAGSSIVFDRVIGALGSSITPFEDTNDYELESSGVMKDSVGGSDDTALDSDVSRRLVDEELHEEKLGESEVMTVPRS